MKDLREAIFNVLNYSVPVKFSYPQGEIEGHLVDPYHFKILLAEYNIHFIEPEDKQETLDESREMIIKSHEIVEKD